MHIIYMIKGIIKYTNTGTWENLRISLELAPLPVLVLRPILYGMRVNKATKATNATPPGTNVRTRR